MLRRTCGGVERVCGEMVLPEGGGDAVRIDIAVERAPIPHQVVHPVVSCFIRIN